MKKKMSKNKIKVNKQTIVMRAHHHNHHLKMNLKKIKALNQVIQVQMKKDRLINTFIERDLVKLEKMELL